MSRRRAGAGTLRITDPDVAAPASTRVWTPWLKV